MISQEQRIEIGELMDESRKSHCLNCVYYGETSLDEETCAGGECRNWDKKYTRDCLLPSDEYILLSFADCSNCANYKKGSLCSKCSRADHEDLWKWNGEN